MTQTSFPTQQPEDLEAETALAELGVEMLRTTVSVMVTQREPAVRQQALHSLFGPQAERALGMAALVAPDEVASILRSLQALGGYGRIVRSLATTIESAKRMAESLDIDIEVQLPDGGEQVTQANDHGLPIAESAAKNPLRKELQKLAKSLYDINKAAETAKA